IDAFTDATTGSIFGNLFGSITPYNAQFSVPGPFQYYYGTGDISSIGASIANLGSTLLNSTYQLGRGIGAVLAGIGDLQERGLNSVGLDSTAVATLPIMNVEISVLKGAEGLQAAQTATKVEQYALVATESKFYPVMKRGFSEPQG